MDNSDFSSNRRKIIKASATSLLMPVYAFAEGQARRPNKYGILGQKAPELEVKT